MHRLPILHQHSLSSAPSATRMRILTLRQDILGEQLDWLATEEPLEMRLQGPGQEMVRVAVTMRTPGHDHELVAGFLYTEGLIHTRHEIVAIQTESSADDPAPRNVVTVHLTRPINPTAVQRNFYTTSSCGICGKASLDQIAVHCAPVAAMAQVPIVCAVSAPSSLAVEVAQRFRMTLVGFLRETQCNVYAHPERLRLDH